MKKLLLICFLLSIFMVITIGANAQYQYMWNAGTTGEGSVGYVYIGVLSEIVNTYAGKDIFMTPIAYTTSLAGLKGFDQKEVASMYANSQVFSNIIYERGPFSPETYKWSAPINQMLWTFTSDYFFIIRKEDADKIKSWSDLANRTVFPRMIGTGTYEYLKVLLGPDGLNIWDTINIRTFDVGHAADALKLKEVDAVAANSTAGEIVSYAQEVFYSTDCVVLGPTPEELEKLVESNDYTFPLSMNPDDFEQDLGLTKTIKNPGMAFQYMVSPDVPEEIVYLVVKTVFENAAEMAELTTIWKAFAEDPWEFNLPFLTKFKEMGVPVHPGALRYFRELGHDTKLLGLE